MSSSTNNNSNKTLVLGATGATGRHVVNFLLQANKPVRVIVRDKNKLNQILEKLNALSSNNNTNSNSLEIVQQSSLSSLSKTDINSAISGCDTVISCLGHNLDFSGIWGSADRQLCTDAAKTFTNAAVENKQKIKFILMNTVGAYNTNLQEDKKASWGLATGINILKWLIPPQWDNMCAISHFVETVGTKNEYVDWCVVRPDSLVDEDKPTPVQAFPSPLSNPLSNPGEISRISVARFMADLDLHNDIFSNFKFQTPAIYNKLPSGVQPPKQ